MRAKEVYITAMSYAYFGGRLAKGCDVGEIGRASRAFLTAPDPSNTLDRVLDGYAALAIDGPTAAAPRLKDALAVFRGPDPGSERDLRYLSVVCPLTVVSWDDRLWDRLTHLYVERVRAVGAGVLSGTLNSLAYLYVLQGELAKAASSIAEVESVNEISGFGYPPHTRALVGALHGHEVETTLVIQQTIDEATASGQGIACRFALSARATLFNGVGRYADALEAAQQADEHPTNWLSDLSAHELIEAAVRSGRPEVAHVALARLVDATNAAGTDWALGVAARTRALVADDASAESLYREAIERLRCTTIRTELARAHLLFGEWLRRASRRVDCREHLRIAHEMLSEMGIAGFAERARRELLATGETVRKRSFETRLDLTPQELQIALLAADGKSNPEIGALLYISPRTVEYHLRKVFTKLDVGSRRELRDALPR
jgi:DNA-binding CsgD family transcriptional regulator